MTRALVTGAPRTAATPSHRSAPRARPATPVASTVFTAGSISDPIEVLVQHGLVEALVGSGGGGGVLVFPDRVARVGYTMGLTAAQPPVDDVVEELSLVLSPDPLFGTEDGRFFAARLTPSRAAVAPR